MARYQCDWIYDVHSPRCTVRIEVEVEPTEPLGRYFFLYHRPFTDAGWTINGGKAFCRIHRDTLLARGTRDRYPYREAVIKGLVGPTLANWMKPGLAAPVLPPERPRRIGGQGMTRPSMDPNSPAYNPHRALPPRP